MNTNDILINQVNSNSDFVERLLTAITTGKVLIINSSNQPEFRLLELADVNTLVTTLASKINSSLINQANGVAGLGADGKINSTLLPDSVFGAIVYKGTWNANTNTPVIPTASSSNKGYYYVVNTAGATNVNGITDWKIGDWIVSNGMAWEKVDNTDQITSVAGKTGAVTLLIADISGLQTALDGKQASLGFTPENVANKAVANGYASLGADGKVPAAQLPSDSNYVATAPTTPSSSGVSGQWSYDSNYYYRCVATNTWKRVALAGVWV